MPVLGCLALGGRPVEAEQVRDPSAVLQPRCERPPVLKQPCIHLDGSCRGCAVHNIKSWLQRPGQARRVIKRRDKPFISSAFGAVKPEARAISAAVPLNQLIIKKVVWKLRFSALPASRAVRASPGRSPTCSGSAGGRLDKLGFRPSVRRQSGVAPTHAEANYSTALPRVLTWRPCPTGLFLPDDYGGLLARSVHVRQHP